MVNLLTARNLLYAALAIALAMEVTACGTAPPPPCWPGLAAADQKVFLSSGSRLHAVDLVTGAEAWHWPAQDSRQTPVFYADPAVAPPALLVSAETSISSNRGIVYAFDIEDGRQLWCLIFVNDGTLLEMTGCKVATNAAGGGIVLPLLGRLFSQPDDSRIFGGITVAGDTAYFGLANGKVYAVDPRDGTERWTAPFQAGGGVWSRPVADADTVYVTSLDHYIYALDRATGAMRWKTDLEAAIAGTAALANGTLYVGTFAGKLYAVNAGDGQKTLIFTSADRQWFWSGPAWQDGTLYFTDLDRRLYAVAADNGEQKWVFESPNANESVMRATPVVIDATVYIGDRSGTLFALDANSGNRRWSQSVRASGRNQGQLLSTPVVVSDTVLIAPYQSEILLRAYTSAGAELWSFPSGSTR